MGHDTVISTPTLPPGSPPPPPKALRMAICAMTSLVLDTGAAALDDSGLEDRAERGANIARAAGR